jgi:hypothetical protein
MPRPNSSLLTSLNLHQDGALRRSRSHIFSLNIIYQTRLSKPIAKTNCRSIEIPLIIPRPGSTPQSGNPSVQVFSSNQDQEMALAGGTKQLASRGRPEMEQFFPFLSLPFELRLKIYALVLPSRTHTIVTQYPHNGYYYSRTSMVSHSHKPSIPHSRIHPAGHRICSRNLPPTSYSTQTPTTISLVRVYIRRSSVPVSRSGMKQSQIRRRGGI